MTRNTGQETYLNILQQPRPTPLHSLDQITHSRILSNNPIGHRSRHAVNLLQHLDERIRLILTRLDLADVHAERRVVALHDFKTVRDRGYVLGEGLEPFGGFGGRGGVVDEAGVGYLEAEEGVFEGVVVYWGCGFGFFARG